ncbi:SCO3242 family prenyltransferase [Streptomyces sp. NPDC059875]|uniref:SCO3242 family prenyltransferase n=1 Tax=unclassified Streptomyces TaxID=2593676 RepID=UPI00364EEA6D
MKGRAASWAELLRVSALFTVPGDALAGAAATGLRPNRSTLLAIGSSLCLYEAGMALNDWADRAEDAVDRPHRPIPSGRITPRAALTASVALTAAGLGLAARAGRPALTVATALATTVWAYDLHLKHTPAGPAAMAGARALDLLLGAVATSATSASPPGTRSRAAGRTGAPNGVTAPTDQPTPAARLTASPRRRMPTTALRSAALLGAHIYAVTAVSRHETQGGSTRTPLLALATTLAVAAAAADAPADSTPDHPVGSTTGSSPRRAGARTLAAPDSRPRPAEARTLTATAGPLVTAVLAAAYARTPATPLLHAALNPSPPLTQRSVGAGIRAVIPLQATLAARAGAPGTALAVLCLAPLARALARKVSPT